MSYFTNLIGLTKKNQKRRNADPLNCLYLLQAKNVCFCLKLKEITVKCPPCCSFYIAGEPASYQDALEKQYDIDCLYCTRREVSQPNAIETPMFYCRLYFQFQPFCGSCQFALYKADPDQSAKMDSSLERNL
ncbi:MAG: hypothetical protein ACFFB5_17785 [Promethearchaeota archaeon]